MGELETELAAAMRLARRGDRGAYAHCLARLASALRPLVARRLGPAFGETEDVVQEVLLAIHLKNDTWDESLPLMPWVHAIAAHKAVDAVRKRQRENRTLAREISAEDLAEVTPSPVSDHVPERDVERSMARLPARQRSVVRALSLEGGTVASVAARLQLSEGAVRVAFHRGLRALKDAAVAGERAPTRSTAKPEWDR